MTLYQEIHLFARGYIHNKSERSSWKKAKIREAYKILTGKEIKITCNTCYIEALLIILNSTPMAARNYELRKGVLLQAFGEPSKTCTNDTLTDELAEWYLKNYPEKIVLFSKVPVKANQIVPSSIKIVEPKKEAAKTETFLPDSAAAAMNAASESIAPKKQASQKPKNPKK